jgi:opacity protein-like surface antigen
VADKDRSDVSTSNFGVRVGPRVRVSDRIQVDPYVTANWFKLDTRVQGTSQLPGAFPDGDDLSVRYDAHVENVDDYSLGVGVNAGLDDLWALQAEYGYAPHGERFMMSIVRRF